MAERYLLTPSQVAALRALNEGIVEMSDKEVAARSLLLLNQARAALGALEKNRLVSSWGPVTGSTVEHLYVANEAGRGIYRALSHFKGTPPTGTIAQVPSPFPGLSRGTYVEIVGEEKHPTQA